MAKKVTVRTYYPLDIYPDEVYSICTPRGYIEQGGGHMQRECQCGHKTKERTEAEYKSLIHRLNRIEGQIRGIRGMVEKNVY